MRRATWSRFRLPKFSLLLVTSAALFCSLPIGSTEAIEAAQPAVVSAPPVPAPAQPTTPTAQKAISESRIRKVHRQRQQPAASMEFGARNGVTRFTPPLMSRKAHAELDTSETEPRYLKIFLLATPDNHRSPPIA